MERGLVAADFEGMTIGMVLDYLVECQNEDIETQDRHKNGTARKATADDIAAF